jgi:hypothetical protein
MQLTEGMPPILPFNDPLTAFAIGNRSFATVGDALVVTVSGAYAEAAGSFSLAFDGAARLQASYAFTWTKAGAALNPRQRQELERLRLASGLPEPAWESVLRQCGPQGELERQRLEPLRAAWLEESGLLAWLNGQLVQNGIRFTEPRSPYVPYRHGATDFLRGIEKQLLATGRGPLFLQDHGSPTRYRNVWIRPLGGK